MIRKQSPVPNHSKSLTSHFDSRPLQAAPEAKSKAKPQEKPKAKAKAPRSKNRGIPKHGFCSVNKNVTVTLVKQNINRVH